MKIMTEIKKQIPNLITLGNLMCGVFATGCAADDLAEIFAITKYGSSKSVYCKNICSMTASAASAS